MTASEWTSQTQGNGAYAEVNGINLYYETHGTGRPLILLHGGLGSGEMFGPILFKFGLDRAGETKHEPVSTRAEAPAAH